MNPYKKLISLLPNPPLLVGTVTAYSDGVATIAQPGGGVSHARGEVTVGDQVYFRDNVVQGPAPDLPVFTMEV